MGDGVWPGDCFECDSFRQRFINAAKVCSLARLLGESAGFHRPEVRSGCFM